LFSFFMVLLLGKKPQQGCEFVDVISDHHQKR